jgi:hypothetical protein
MGIKNTRFDVEFDFKIYSEFCVFDALIELVKEILENLAHFVANSHQSAKNENKLLLI